MTMRVHLTGMRGAGWINIYYETCGFEGLSAYLVCGEEVQEALLNLQLYGVQGLKYRKQPIIILRIYIFCLLVRY